MSFVASRRFVSGVLVVVVAGALVGAAAAVLAPTDNRGNSASEESGVSESPAHATGTAVPSEGSTPGYSQGPTPSPVLQTASPVVPSPPAANITGPPAEWAFGTYVVRFSLEADSCGVSVQEQEHELVLLPTEAGVRIEDRTVPIDAVEGPLGADGAFRAEFSRELLPQSRMVLRQVMVGKVESSGSLSGRLFVYPGFRDCAVMLAFEGNRRG